MASKVQKKAGNTNVEVPRDDGLPTPLLRWLQEGAGKGFTLNSKQLHNLRAVAERPGFSEWVTSLGDPYSLKCLLEFPGPALRKLADASSILRGRWLGSRASRCRSGPPSSTSCAPW